MMVMMVMIVVVPMMNKRCTKGRRAIIFSNIYSIGGMTSYTTAEGDETGGKARSRIPVIK